jgi:hypothetical protein
MRPTPNRPEWTQKKAWILGSGLLAALTLVGSGIGPVLKIQAREVSPLIPGVDLVCDSSVSCLRILRFENESFDKQAGAIVALGALRERLSVPDLIAVIQSHAYGDRVYHYDDTPNSLLVVTAMRALGTIGDPRAIPVLIEFIKKEAYIQYRVLAAEMVKMIGIHREDIPLVLELLNDPHTSIRYIIFEAVRFADDPVSKSYTKRFISTIPRADMIEDTVTTPPDARDIGVPIYPGSRYVMSASASEQWIMRDRPESLGRMQWVHTFLTGDPLSEALHYYEEVLQKKAVTGKAIMERFGPSVLDTAESASAGEGYGFILTKAQWPSLRTPVVVVTLYPDALLKGTAISIFAPK